jgi:hypothetical protein
MNEMNKLKWLIISCLLYFSFCSDTDVDAVVKPPSRNSHSSAFNSDTQELLIFGGSISSGADNSLWIYKNSTWLKANSTGPANREDALLVYHADHKKTYLIGGRNFATNEIFRDQWSWDGTKWQLVADDLPFGPIVHSSVTYDKKNKRILMFGGSTSELRSDLWIWDGVSWKKSSAAGPEARLASSLVYSHADEKIYLFGGSTSNGTPFADVWQLDGESWTKVNNTMPEVLPGAYGIAQTGNNKFLLFGGFLQSRQNFSETWLWDGVNWSKQNITSPSARALHTMVYDDINNKVFLFGGGSAGILLSDLWIYSGNEWSKVHE